MNQVKIQSVDITIGTKVYSTFEALPNTVSHVLAEFVDNALQSYRDNKDKLSINNPLYKLCVDIDIEWDENDGRAIRIVVIDNAAGIDSETYKKAFMPAEKPVDNTGLNEFGMGLKTAACWLGETWSVYTKALGEIEERTVTFDLNDVMMNDLKEIPVQSKLKDVREHYTTLSVTNLNKNAPKIKSQTNIRNELASIYRKSLREDEMVLSFCGERLSFTDYEVLVAPFVRTPDEPPIYWRKEIDYNFGKYKAKGFIAILKNMNKDHNRIVLLRRGRVIVGAETEGHYYSKHISGQSGSPRDKRIFGELELEGFDVAFNKNDIQDKENLEALMAALSCEIHKKEFDLTTQAQEYRQDENQKLVKRIITKHNSQPKEKRQPIEVDTRTIDELPKIEVSIDPKLPSISASLQSSVEQVVIGEYDDKYRINGADYTLTVQFVDNRNGDLFWVDVTQKNENVIICKINTGHIFFNHFGKPSDSIIAILKTIAISKFTARESGDNSATDLFNHFNAFIKQTKV